MTETTGEIVGRLKFANRPNASRKLLGRKASEKAASTVGDGRMLEAAFPKSETAPAAATPALPTGTAVAASSNVAPLPLPWSDEDESVFQAMSARRKAAGCQRRGGNLSAQVLTAGVVTPNAGTICSVIVALVAEGGTMVRSALIEAMASAAFSHPKAKPQDRLWCQGYVSGALRDGFLALAVPAAGSSQ